KDGVESRKKCNAQHVPLRSALFCPRKGQKARRNHRLSRNPSERPLNSNQWRYTVGQTLVSDVETQIEIDEQPRCDVGLEAQRSVGDPVGIGAEADIRQVGAPSLAGRVQRVNTQPWGIQDALAEDVKHHAELWIYRDIAAQRVLELIGEVGF